MDDTHIDELPFMRNTRITLYSWVEILTCYRRLKDESVYPDAILPAHVWHNQANFSTCFVILVTSTTEGEGGYVFTSFCLFVCLCAGYLKKLWTDLDEILRTGSVCDKDEMIRFW